MKLASSRVSGRDSYGIVAGSGIVDLGARLWYPTLRHAIASGARAERAASVRTSGPDRALADVELAVPIPDAEKIICIGCNYRSHVAEVDIKLPVRPSLFLRLHNSLVPPGPVRPNRIRRGAARRPRPQVQDP